MCGYRSPDDQLDAAPALERRRQVQPAHAAARRSTSTFPACRSMTLRAAGLRSQRGGVGYYPRRARLSCTWTPAACGTGRACRRRSSQACWPKGPLASHGLRQRHVAQAEVAGQRPHATPRAARQAVRRRQGRGRGRRDRGRPVPQARRGSTCTAAAIDGQAPLNAADRQARDLSRSPRQPSTPVASICRQACGGIERRRRRRSRRPRRAASGSHPRARSR